MKHKKVLGIMILLTNICLLLTPINAIGQAEEEQKWIQLPEEWDITPKAGGTLVVQTFEEPKQFNPNYDWVDETGWCSNVFNKLVQQDTVNLNIVPDIAISWDVSDDCTTYTFYLHEDVYFHDGIKCTSEDVRFSYQDVIDQKGFYLKQLAQVTSIETPDDYTVVFTLNRTDATFLTQLAHSYSPVILPKHLYEGTDRWKNPYNLRPIGTGPFKFVEYYPGSHVICEANLNYFKGRPYLDRYITRYIESEAATTLALKKNEIQLTWHPPSFSALPELEALPHIDVDSEYLSVLLWVGFNLDREPWTDLNVRKAIVQAINITDVSDKASFGIWHPNPYAWGEVGFPMWSFNPDAKQPEYDPEEAERLLDEADYPRGSDGIRFKTTITTFNEMQAPETCEVIREYLSKVGIDMDIEVYEWTTYTEKVVTNHDFDTTVAGGYTGPDPAILEMFLASDGYRNVMSYNNPEVDRLFLEGKSTVDLEDRQKAYWEIWEILVEEIPRFNIAVYAYPFPYNNEYHGFWFDRPYNNILGYGGLELVWWDGGKEIVTEPTPLVGEELEPRVASLENSLSHLSTQISGLSSQIEDLESQIVEPVAPSQTLTYVALLVAIVAVVLTIYFQKQK